MLRACFFILKVTPVEHNHAAKISVSRKGDRINYVGKIGCCFGKRMDEHGSKPDQPMYQNLVKCEQFNFMTSLHDLPVDGHGNLTKVNVDSHIYEAVKNNSKVLISSRDWLINAFLEPYMAKKHKATINYGSKAMKVLHLF